MAEAGAFGPELAGETAELVYWHLTGGFVPGEERTILRADAARIAAAVATARRQAGRADRRRSTIPAAPICRSRIPAGRRAFPTMRSSPASPNGTCPGDEA